MRLELNDFEEDLRPYIDMGEFLDGFEWCTESRLEKHAMITGASIFLKCILDEDEFANYDYSNKIYQIIKSHIDSTTQQ